MSIKIIFSTVVAFVLTLPWMINWRRKVNRRDWRWRLWYSRRGMKTFCWLTQVTLQHPPPLPYTMLFCRSLRDHLDHVHGSSCFMYGDHVPKKTIHSGILQTSVMSHSFVPNKIEGFIMKGKWDKDKRCFIYGMCAHRSVLAACY